mgnify:CR=1 FL=1
MPFTLNADEFDLYKAVTGYINQFIPQQQGPRKTSAALGRTKMLCDLNANSVFEEAEFREVAGPW